MPFRYSVVSCWFSQAIYINKHIKTLKCTAKVMIPLLNRIEKGSILRGYWSLFEFSSTMNHLFTYYLNIINLSIFLFDNIIHFLHHKFNKSFTISINFHIILNDTLQIRNIISIISSESDRHNYIYSNLNLHLIIFINFSFRTTVSLTIFSFISNINLF